MRARNRSHPLIVAVSLAAACGCSVRADDGVDRPRMRNGSLFDHGARRLEPAATAPAPLADLVGLIGDWDVSIEEQVPDQATRRGKGLATISFLNRGHGYLAAMHLPRFGDDDVPLDTLTLLAFSPSAGLWAMGQADSQAQRIQVFSGPRSGVGRLELTAVERPLGGPRLATTTLAYTLDDDRLIVTETERRQGEATPTRERRAIYRRRPKLALAAWAKSGFGAAAPDRPVGAEGFDFAIGRWTANHAIRTPTGQMARFPSAATAVFALNGHAVLEHLWYDVDPSKPDAAITALRLYNSAMRRWECLFIENRTHALLHFGGRAENARIVLHNFGASAADPVISRFTFFDIRSDTYAWKGEDSRDRGRAWVTSWAIDFSRQQAESP